MTEGPPAHTSGQGGIGAGAGPPSLGPGPAWRIRGGQISLDGPVVMGILNLTPDSFSDGGRFRSVDEAIDAAGAMAEAGATLLDVGGESTRPGARAVPAAEEADRILPFLERATGTIDVAWSVDTRKASVARAALEAGAAVVNDVSGLFFDEDMAGTVAETGAGVVLMHMRGTPADMGTHARYRDVVGEVASELARSVDRARERGIPDACIVVDPGIGFAKDTGHSLALLARPGPVQALGFPVLVGPSRKRFLGEILGVPPHERVSGTVAACVAAYLLGVKIFRVHDVGPVSQALRVGRAILEARAADATEEVRA